jgi:1-aminocyclopropane-1-carboxylate deaminase
MLELKKPLLNEIKDVLFEEKGLKVYVLRLDAIHPFISGNKWYKLKYNIDEFKKSGKKFLVTFGGAFSNHIVATAAAGRMFDIKTIGIIRGEELNVYSNKVLEFANRSGMKLVFVKRDKYRELKQDNNKVEAALSPLLGRGVGGEAFIVPEGGSNELALKGCEEIKNDIPIDFDYILTACGTGMTLAGIAKSLEPHQQAVGISVLHGESFLDTDVAQWSGRNFKIIHDYHFGGYAKTNDKLNTFCNEFYFKHHIRMEPIYPGKMFYGFYDLIKKDFFPHGKTIIALHTGGIFDFTKG